MSVDLRTRGLDWRARVRENDLFAVLVTPTWYRDRLCQRQLAYARQLGKPIVFYVKTGTALPPLREGEDVLPFATPAELAALLQRLTLEGA